MSSKASSTQQPNIGIECNKKYRKKDSFKKKTFRRNFMYSYELTFLIKLSGDIGSVSVNFLMCLSML